MRNAAIFLIIAGVFSFGIVFTGCAGIPPAEAMGPDSSTAKVYFIMPSGVTVTGFGSLTVGTQFSLWNGDTFLSNIGGKEYLVYYFKAGMTHHIMAYGNEIFVAKADLTAGKTYYLKVVTLPGFRTPHVIFEELDVNSPDLDEYLKDKCKEISPKGKVSDSMVKRVVEKLALVAKDPEEIDMVLR